jgi:hypothetical protein
VTACRHSSTILVSTRLRWPPPAGFPAASGPPTPAVCTTSDRCPGQLTAWHRQCLREGSRIPGNHGDMVDSPCLPAFSVGSGGLHACPVLFGREGLYGPAVEPIRGVVIPRGIGDPDQRVLGADHYPTGPDAVPFLAWRASMSDEAWIDLGAMQDDEAWCKRITQDFGLDVRSYLGRGHRLYTVPAGRHRAETGCLQPTPFSGFRQRGMPSGRQKVSRMNAILADGSIAWRDASASLVARLGCLSDSLSIAGLRCPSVGGHGCRGTATVLSDAGGYILSECSLRTDPPEGAQ